MNSEKGEITGLRLCVKHAAFLIVIQLLVYFPFVTGKLTNPDAVQNGTLYKEAYTWEITLGRPLLALDGRLTNYTISPSFMTLAAIALTSFSAAILMQPFRLRSGKLRFLCECLLVLAPAVWCTYTYYFCSAFYAKSLLLACASFGIVSGLHAGRKRQNVLLLLLAGCVLSLSLATYQAYIAVYVTFACLWLIHEALRTGGPDFRSLLRSACRFLAVMILGIALYLAGWKLLLALMQLTADSGRGFDQMGHLRWRELPQQLGMSYVRTFQYFFRNTMLNNSYSTLIPRWGYNTGYLLVTGIPAVYALIRSKRETVLKAAAALLTGLLPVFLMCITIAAPDTSILSTTGCIMLPAMNAAYLAPILIAEADPSCMPSQAQHRDRVLTTIAGCVILWMLTLLSLDGEQYMTYERNKAYHVAEEISRQLDEIPDPVYEKGMRKVCIVGNYEDGHYPNQFPRLKTSVQWTSASLGMFWTDYTGQFRGMRTFFADEMGAGYSMASEAEYEAILQTDEFREMTVFPEKESVRKIGDFIVVRLSKPDV